jgi:hypothetical protein
MEPSLNTHEEARVPGTELQSHSPDLRLCIFTRVTDARPTMRNCPEARRLLRDSFRAFTTALQTKCNFAISLLTRNRKRCRVALAMGRSAVHRTDATVRNLSTTCGPAQIEQHASPPWGTSNGSRPEMALGHFHFGRQQNGKSKNHEGKFEGSAEAGRRMA